MSLQDLQLFSSYETDEEKQHLLDNFYIPVLEQANKYYRIAGFFSSTALSVASKGIEGLVHNGGEMYLLISPELSQEDYNTICKYGTLDESAALFTGFQISDDVSENVQALAWMLYNGTLKIKIVVPKRGRSSLFHQKVGIVFDESGNMISFSGSINESAQAWLNNIEEFKVFRSWVDGQSEYLLSDLDKFLNYWKGNKSSIAEVFDLPDAIKEKIISVRPRNVLDLNIMRRYQKDVKLQRNKLSLFPHQQQAVDMWNANGCSLLMEMATGTGKTRTAIGCLTSILPKKEKLLVIVATPQNTLSRQWKTDFEDLQIILDRSAVIDGSNPSWKKDLEFIMLDLAEGTIRTAILFTTHDTASSNSFTQIVSAAKYDCKIMFIGDEVHAVGSKEQRKALLDIYDYRVGLSATPERMFDLSGTSLIRTYFGNRSFEFTISDALKTINPITGRPFLNEYYYYPIFVQLTDKEYSEYVAISKQIRIMLNQEDYDEDDLQKLYERRSKKTKNAANKLSAFKQLLTEIGPDSITDTIVFVSDKQMQPVIKVLTEAKIKRSKITESESATRKVNSQGETERQEIISQFKRHELQVLIGIKCLDEGIDIKNARVAILMSSSTNPREYVQRVGRVIRQDIGKEHSVIYDLIATSPDGGSDKILSKEARRASLIARNALNYDEVCKEFLLNGVDLNAYQ